MKDAKAIKLLQDIEKTGVRYSVDVPLIEGNQSMLITSTQAHCMQSDPIKVFADLLGLSVMEYEDYMASGGSVVCSATTTKCAPCRGHVIGCTRLSPSEWKERRSIGGYCCAHGG